MKKSSLIYILQGKSFGSYMVYYFSHLLNIQIQQMIKQSNRPHPKYPSISVPFSTPRQISTSSTTLPIKRNPLRVSKQQIKTKRQIQKPKLQRTTSRMMRKTYSQNKTIFKDIRYIRARSLKNNSFQQQNMQNFKQQKRIDYNNQYEMCPNARPIKLHNKQNINKNKTHFLLKILEEQKQRNNNLTNKLEQYSKQIILLKKQLSNKQNQLSQKNQYIRNVKNLIDQNQYCIRINNIDKQTKRKISHNRNPSDPIHHLKMNLSQNTSLGIPIPINISSPTKQIPSPKIDSQTSKILSQSILDSQDHQTIQKFVNEHLQTNNQKQLSGISLLEGDERQNKRLIKILQDQLKYKDIEICMLKKMRDQQRKQFMLKQKLLKVLMSQLKDIKTKLQDHNCGNNQPSLRQAQSDVTLEYSIQ